MAIANNKAVVAFAADAVASGEDATHFAVWRDGAVKARAAINTDPAPITAGQFYQFAAGRLEIELPAGALSPGGAVDALNGVLSAETQVSLHSGDPGEDGSAHELTTVATRAPVPADGWTIA